jgi:hypothetical protein
MMPVRAPLSQRSRNIRANQAPRAPGQVRVRELMRTPKFRPAGSASKNARRIANRFEDCHYVAVRNPHDSEGRWKIRGSRHTIYGKANLTESERIADANELAGAR